MYKPSPEGKSYTQKRLCHWHSLFCMYEEERGWRFTEEFSAFARIPQYADGPAGKKKSCIRAAAVRTQDHKNIGVARLELAASCSQSRRATNCATPRHPAVQLHRQSIVYRFLRGSSIQNPQLRAPVLFEPIKAAVSKKAMAGTFCKKVWFWCNCRKADAKTRQSAKLVAL